MTNKTTKPKKSWLQHLRDKLRLQRIKLRMRWHALWTWILNKIEIKKLIYFEIAILLLLGLYFLMGDTILWNIVTVGTLSDKCASKDISDLAKCTEITRNFGWLIWMLLSATGVGFGLWLTWLGRQIQDKQWDTQHKSHLQERFEKATDMLGNDVELVRIAGCRSLMNLGKSDEAMKAQCVRLLFAFINNPYLEDEEKGNCLNLKGYAKDVYFNKLFPADEPLRPDIQEAIASFSAIYEHYGEDGIDNEAVKLPSYFWKNKNKGMVSLIKTNLMFTELEGAYLEGANLEGSYLASANLEGANLKWAKLEKALSWSIKLDRANLLGTKLGKADLHNMSLHDADISKADMREAKGLTKDQILSAKWGYDMFGRGGPPILLEDLMQDKDIRKWLENPHFDKRMFPKDPKSSQ